MDLLRLLVECLQKVANSENLRVSEAKALAVKVLVWLFGTRVRTRKIEIKANALSGSSRVYVVHCIQHNTSSLGLSSCVPALAAANLLSNVLIQASSYPFSKS